MHEERPNDIWPQIRADAGHLSPDGGSKTKAVTPPPLPTGGAMQPLDAGEPTNRPGATEKEQHHPLKTSRTVTTKSRLFPAVVGFIAGAVFWHLVGFWSLVADMVFSGPREKTVVISSSFTLTPSDYRTNERATHGTNIQTQRLLETDNLDPRTGSNAFNAEGCTTLSQETPGGPMKKVPCPRITQTGQETMTSTMTSSIEEESGNIPPTEESFAVIENRGWSAFTTGSIKKRTDQTVSSGKQEDWAASLVATPASAGQ